MGISQSTSGRWFDSQSKHNEREATKFKLLYTLPGSAANCHVWTQAGVTLGLCHMVWRRPCWATPVSPWAQHKTGVNATGVFNPKVKVCVYVCVNTKWSDTTFSNPLLNPKLIILGMKPDCLWKWLDSHILPTMVPHQSQERAAICKPFCHPPAELTQHQLLQFSATQSKRIPSGNPNSKPESKVPS